MKKVTLICWESDCTYTRDVALCHKCQRPFCPEHMSEIGLCLWCTPVDEEEYQEWTKRVEGMNGGLKQ